MSECLALGNPTWMCQYNCYGWPNGFSHLQPMSSPVVLEDTIIARNKDRLNLHSSFANIQQLRDSISSIMVSEGIAFDIGTRGNPWGGTADPGGYPYPLALTGKLNPYGACEFWIYHDHIAGREYAEKVVVRCQQPYGTQQDLELIVRLLRTHPALGRGRSQW